MKRRLGIFGPLALDDAQNQQAGEDRAVIVFEKLDDHVIEQFPRQRLDDVGFGEDRRAAEVVVDRDAELDDRLDERCRGREQLGGRLRRRVFVVRLVRGFDRVDQLLKDRCQAGQLRERGNRNRAA